MTREAKIVIAAAIGLGLLFAFNSMKTEYARIQSRVEITQAKVDALADELQATTAALHDAIKRFKDRFMQIEGELKPMTPDEIEAFNDLQNVEVKTVPKLSASTVPTIVMHSGYDCGPCNAWILRDMPRWIQSGWAVEVVKEIDSGVSWPWYEIRDRDGSQFEVNGPLTNDNFQAAKAGAK